MPMKKTIAFIALAVSWIGSGLAQTTQKGPYTVYDIGEQVYRIEDSNDKNPPGATIGDDGVLTHMNNCSDMYLVVGKEKGLLIDLSNKLTLDQETRNALRSLVYDRLEGSKLYISVTHRHGDHLGMLPVFKDDPEVTFWVPGDEFSGMDIFPEGRTVYFEPKASLDLGGGRKINTMEVPGHTAHSTLFFLEGENLVFTGDAIGSGSGVWLFNEESFQTYSDGVEKLISYIEDPDNRVNAEKLTIYGGHYWQGKDQGVLGSQYIYDMRKLIEAMKVGKAETEGMSAAMPFLNTNFKYGTATITWNKEAAERLVNK